MSSVEPEEPEGLSILFPLTNMKSAGGLFDDESFCAGFEMGQLLQEMKTADSIEQNIRYDNRQQADLIAMHSGFTVEFEGEGYEWLWMKAERISAAGASNDGKVDP